MSNKHRFLRGSQLHNPKGFDSAAASTRFYKDGGSNLFWFNETHFPSALDYVSCQSTPPTEVAGDIYIIDDTGTDLDIDTIAWQSGNTIRYTFNGSPSLTAFAAGDYIVVSGSANTSNDGIFFVDTVNSGSFYVDVTNPFRSDATDDEASDASGTCYFTLAEWDGAVKGSHLRYDGNIWISSTAQDGALCYEQTNSLVRVYDALNENWDTSLGGGGGAISNVVEDTTPQLGGNLDANGFYIDMGTNNITDTKVGQWDTAYSWGDHSTAGYLTSYTETDPVFTASAAAGITSGNITNWNTAYGWGDHSTQGYVTSTSEASSRIAVFTGADAIEGDANLTWNGGLVVTSSSVDAVSVIHTASNTTNIAVDATVTTGASAANSYGHRGIVNAAAGGNGYGGFFQTSRTDGVSDTAFGVYGKVGGGDLGGPSYGGFHFVEVSGSNSSGGTIHGSKAQVTVNTSGTHTSTIFGVASDINYDKTGGTLGTAAGFHHSGAVVNTGTITNAYGIYLGDNTGTGTITNSYGVFQIGSDDKNYFAGSLEIDNTVKIASASDQQLFLDKNGGNYIRYRTAAGVNRGYLGYTSGGDFNIVNAESSALNLYTNNTLGIEIDTSSNVTVPNGRIISTSNESYPFRIEGTRQNVGYTFTNGATVRANVGYGQVTVGGSPTDSFNIQNNENSPMRFYTNSTERVQITAAGNVGIGETSPQVKLHASGSGEIARLETSAGTGDNYFTFYDTAQKGLIGYESGSDDLIIENAEVGQSIIFRSALTGGSPPFVTFEIDGTGDSVTSAGVFIANSGFQCNGDSELTSTTHSLQLNRWTSSQQSTNLSSYTATEQGSVWFNSSDSSFLGWDGSSVVNLSPKGTTTVTELDSSVDGTIYSDSNIELNWDASGSDIEAHVLTNPSADRVHFVASTPSGDFSVDGLTTTTPVDLYGLFSSDTIVDIMVNAPSDTSYPSYHIKIKRSNSTFYTGTPFMVIATKYTSYD